MKGNPRKPVGSSPKVNFDRRNHEEIYQKLRFVNTPTVKFDRTMRGVRARVIMPPRRREPEKFFPFRCYQSPLPTSPDETQLANAWRTYRVRNGRVVGNTTTPVETLGTDLVTRPDSADIPAYSNSIEILLPLPTPPAEALAHWFWLQIDEGSATAQIQHSATPPTQWTMTKILIAKLTVSTEEVHEVVVDQFLRTDVIIPCLEFPPE